MMHRSINATIFSCSSFAVFVRASPSSYGSIVTALGNGTVPYPCNETGWTSSPSTGASNCNASTTTITITATSTWFPSTVTTQVLATDAHSINGDDCPPYCGPRTVPSTETYTQYITSSLDKTTTLTITTTPTTRIGMNATVTAATPTGFLPIKTTVPEATYLDRYRFPDPAAPMRRRDLGPRAALSSPCEPRTTTLTRYINLTSTATVTQSLGAGGGLVWVFPLENTIIDGATYTYPSPTFLIITATTTVYAATSTATSTAPTTTILPTTTTIYAACATNNFADAINLGNGSTSPVRGSSAGDQTIAEGPFAGTWPTPYECCASSIESGAEGWLWGGAGNTTDFATCYLLRSSATSACSAASNNFAVLYGQLDPFYETIAGNSYCGTFSSAKEDPNATLNLM